MVVDENIADLELGSQPGIVDKLWKSVGKSTGTDIVNGQDWVWDPVQRDARVDDLLASPLHLWVISLDRSKVEVSRTRAGSLRRCGASSKSDEEARSSEDHNLRSSREPSLLRKVWSNVSDTTSNHDRLVVPAHFSRLGCRRNRLRKRSKISYKSIRKPKSSLFELTS